MGLIDFLFKPSFEKHEARADRLAARGDFGSAKLAYEKALSSLPASSTAGRGIHRRIDEKRRQACEKLARGHQQNGVDLVDAGCPKDAEELFVLALELTEDAALAAEIRSCLESIRSGDTPSSVEQTAPADDNHGGETDDDITLPAGSPELFNALLASLPEAEQSAYADYGDDFRTGYLLLNQGDFKGAISHLSRTLDNDSSPNSYVRLELATAYLNLGDLDRARALLETFIKTHPESLRAHELLCDILWEARELDTARDLLQNCPPELSQTVSVNLLKGETLRLSGRYGDAISFFQEIIDSQGWDSRVAAAMAATFEEMGKVDQAREIYSDIIGKCRGCGSRIDPTVKRRFAETSFIIGDHSAPILELFLELAHEDPDHRSNYYEKISRIYQLQGNENEAQRFAAFARQHL